jgi:hypothetical protein
MAALRLSRGRASATRPLDASRAAGAAIAVVGPEGGFAADEVAAARDARLRTGRPRAAHPPRRDGRDRHAALCLHRWGDVGRLSSPDQLG